MIGCNRPNTTTTPLSAPHATPTSSTSATPSPISSGVPVITVDATQLVITNTLPTDRSRPAVRTGRVWAIATSASSTPLLAAVLMMSALNPAGCWVANTANIAANSTAASIGPRCDDSQ